MFAKNTAVLQSTIDRTDDTKRTKGGEKSQKENAVTYHYPGNFALPSSKARAIKCSPKRSSPSCHA